MFSTLRNRFGIPGVISVIALVFAMIGGAYAASNSGDGKNATASAKKKATKGPRGPKGPKGPAGPAGAQGPAGPAGAKGDAGAAGANGAAGEKGDKGATGTNGTSVTSTPVGPGPDCSKGGVVFKIGATPAGAACNGANGTNGEDGQTGFTATLPSGETETGTWVLNAAPSQGIAGFGGTVFTEISFNIPLASAPTPHFQSEANFADFDGPGGSAAGCTGSASNPTAPSGHLCVYDGGTSGIGITNYTFGGFVAPDLNFVGPGTTPAGTLLGFTISDTEPTFATGTYAATG